MAIGEQGEYIGRTWGDVTSEISAAMTRIGTDPGAPPVITGDEWTVYRGPNDTIRAYMSVPEMAVTDPNQLSLDA